MDEPRTLSAQARRRLEQLQAAARLRERVPALRPLSARHLRCLLRAHLEHGWTAAGTAADHHRPRGGDDTPNSRSAAARQGPFRAAGEPASRPVGQGRSIR